MIFDGIGIIYLVQECCLIDPLALSAPSRMFFLSFRSLLAVFVCV
jgi:hypothetical protein